jgi:capsule polysaccharide export protein KpsE/RkpR
MKLMDRVAAGLDQLGKKAAQAIDESKLRMEAAGVRRRKDHAARDLGYLTYRQSKGEVLAEGDTDLQIRRIAAAEEEIAKLEADLAKVRARNVPPASEAPPAGAAETPVEPPPGAKGDQRPQAG